QREGHDAVDPEARGQGERVVADDPHGDRHDPGDEGRPCRQGDGGERRVSVLEPARQDERVEEDDVGHDHERGQAGPGLRDEVRPPFAELEVRRDPIHADLTLHSVRAGTSRGLGPRRLDWSLRLGRPTPPSPQTLEPCRPGGRDWTGQAAGSGIRYSTSRASRPSSSIWTKPLVSNSSCWAPRTGVPSTDVSGAYSMTTRSSPWTRL